MVPLLAALMRYRNIRIQVLLLRANDMAFLARWRDSVSPRIFFGALNNCDITSDGTLSHAECQ